MKYITVAPYEKYFTLRLLNGNLLLETQSTNKAYTSVSVKLIKSIMKGCGANHCEVYVGDSVGYVESTPIEQISIK
jgi:hypothetical protein